MSGIEEVKWGPASILRKVNDGVYICTCNVHNVKYDLWTKYAFVYDSHYKPLNGTDCCGVLIDNRSDAPICVLGKKDRVKKRNMDYALHQFFEGKCHVEQVYRITSC